jgi:hypothetical protein
MPTKNSNFANIKCCGGTTINTNKTMKTKTIFTKKVAFVCCLWVLSMLGNKLHAQIVYTDIPDATPNATYPLDLNNDSIVDFFIRMGAIGVNCYAENNNAYSGNIVSGLHLPYALSASANICDTMATWYDANNPGTMALGGTLGYWLGAVDKYLALKLIVGTNTYYGWVRIDFLFTAGSFTIKDYAYQSTPNACIEAGQTTLATDDDTTNAIVSIFPNPCTTTTTIRTTGKLENATLTIYDPYGQTVKQIKNIAGQAVTLYRNDLASGVYCIRITQENKTIALKKWIITD